MLFYRRRTLLRYINKKECRRFLYDMGYGEGMDLDECLMQLKQRFEHLCPHEIGVFLGIPVEDIKGFIQHKGEKSLMCSKYWKVYKNPRRSLSLFNTYDRAMAFVPGAIEKIYAHY
ncbi:DUF3793 family protein [Anaerobacterium chartisolvens]|nr:DUF3793 family protein [Anaerobacterium chartisolvens]